ncbi:AGE family epimerase/isomerase [Pelagicoccus sp. SDUM812005]|uniref:AGE family epimerase/isomerase n=1 Tax=Pelagicoccus sp. SDUM812005 TaxID=3041257 RepID=UPI00280F7221|nr:AGE family epimerase/isomerase [Pelagicoccus sp. SDUM812005]MDQ8183339.1 AGE family epimerase/isomerase [Pelagicoccus sp. SDUM812005]
MPPSPLKTFQQELQAELFENILPYWPRLRTTDSFIPALDSLNQPVAETPLGLVMVSRLLWTYSRAYSLYGKKEYRKLADHAKHVLCIKFSDTENGGYYWTLTPDGQALETKKQCYGQAFCIYAFSEHYHATREQDSLDRAYSLFRLVEAKAWDPASGGYLESFEADWTPLAKMKLGDGDLEAPKTMNNHLHIIEAFANLQKISPSPEVEAACRRTLQTIADRIILPDTPRFGLFYDKDWKLLDPVVSPGHDIEGSWLLHEAATIIGDPEQEKEFQKLALEMAEQVLRSGIDPHDHGVHDEFHPGQPPNGSKCWWPQAEGMVGFYNAYQLSGDTRYLEACLQTWEYIKSAFIDRTNGEWLWGRQADGRPMDKEKAGPWKSSYHNGRACFELLERIQRVN